MIEFKTEKGEFVVVDLPTEVKTVQDSFCDAILTTHHDGYIETYYPYEDNEVEELKLICKLSEVREDDLKKVFEYMLANDNDEYGDYEVYLYFHPNGTTSYLADSAEESLKSFLRFKGINVNNGNWYLFKKLK